MSSKVRSNLSKVRAALLPVLLGALPAIAHAQQTDYSFKGLVGKATGILQSAVSVIFWVVFFYVVWTLIQTWTRKSDDLSARTRGKNTLVAGIVGLVVLGSLWGIIAFLQNAIFL